MIRRGLQQRAANDSNEFKKVNSERSIAFDSDVVHLSGNETVSGYKTFANDIYVGDASLNNVRITQTDIRKMTDGSVKTYSFPDKSGYFSLEGHKHESIENLQSGTKIYSVGKDGKIDSYGNSLEFDSTNQATGQTFRATMSFGKAFNEIYESQDGSTMSVKLRLYMKEYPYFPLCEELNTVATKNGNNWFLADQPVFSDSSWGQYADYFRTSPFYFNFEIPFTGNFYFGEYWGPASYSDTDARSGVITKTIATESDIDSLSGSISKNYLTKNGDQVISNKYLNGPFIFSPVQISDSERVMNTSLAKDDMFDITYKFPSVKSDGSDEAEWAQKSGNSYTLETKEDASATYVLRNNGITNFWNNASASEGVQIGVSKLAVANPDFLTPIDWKAGMPTFRNPSGGYYFLPNLKSNGSQELFSLPYSSNGTKSYGIIAGSSQFPQISGDSQVSDKDNLIYALQNFGRGNSVIVSPDLINSPGMPFVGTMNSAGTGQVWYYLPQLNERHESEQNILATLGDIASETSGYVPYTDSHGIVAGADGHADAAGEYSIAVGSAAHADGECSVALGKSASALGLNSVAIGGTSYAEKTGSIALCGGKAYGAQSFALGPTSTASGNFSMVFGRGNHANNTYAIAFGGLNNQSDAMYSITMGYRSHAYNDDENSFTWNGTKALGIQNEYAANGGGTFNINPSAGTSGFYIGTKNLATILREQDGFVPTSGGIVTNSFKLINSDGYNLLSGVNGGGLAIGLGSVATEGGNAAVGMGTTAMGYDNTAIGWNAGVGKLNENPGPDGGAEELAIGANSRAMGGMWCVQIGAGLNEEPYSLKVFDNPILKSKSGSNYNDFEVVCPVSGYLPLTGGDMSGVVNDEIDWPYISATNILLEDEADGTSNKVMVNVSLDTTSSDLIIAYKTKEYPSPIAINTEIVAVTGNPSEFPMDITKLSGEKSLVWTTGAECYRYIDGNDTLEIWLRNDGNFDFYFSTSDEEHYYGTENITPTETTKKVSSRFITEMEVDRKLKANASFDLWRKGNTIYAGTGSDHLSAGTNNSVFIGSNQTITDGKGNSVVIGSNAKSNGDSNTIIGYGAYATGTGTGNVLIGYNARNTTNQGNAVSIGYGAVSQYYGIAIGHSADANKENAVSIGWKTNCRTAKDIAIGREAQTSGGDGNFSNIAIGAWSKAFSTGGSTAIAIGGGTVSGNLSIALGGSVYADDAIQLGNGSNTTPHTLQYRDKTIADTAGRLYYGEEDIDSLYVSKKNDTIISANLNATLEHQMGVGDIGNDEPFALMYADDQDGYLYAGKSMQEYTWLNTGKICSTTDAEATTTELLIPPPSGSGTIATQEWTKKATNILPIASFANYPSTIAISADKYAYRISDTGATGAFPSLTPPSGLSDCYLKFEIEWTTSATLLSYPQSGTTVPAMEWITPPPPPEDGNTHTFYIAGRYDYTRGMFIMNCWRDVTVGG